jgi:DNA-binding SARP family transcriptional activator
VLKYLVCNRHRVVTAEELAGAFWPDAGRRALSSVRHYVHELRDRLEPDREKRVPSSFVAARQGGYTLLRSRVTIDLDDFERDSRGGLAAFDRGDARQARELLAAAQALYGGDLFAEDPYDFWTLDERDRLRELSARGLRALAQIAEEAGELDVAHEQLSRLAALEPYDMGTQRELILSFLRLGRRSEASRRFSALRARMLHEFSEEPGFGLGELSAELRRAPRPAA